MNESRQSSPSMHTVNVVAYYRVSTSRQGESGLGLEAQKNSVRLYLSNYAIPLVKEFIEVESGKTRDRPVLKKTLSYCRKNRCLLVIAKLDRLGRNVAFISALMASKVKFTAVDTRMRMNLSFIFWLLSPSMIESISVRTKSALQAAKARGVALAKYGKDVLSKKNKAAAIDFAEKIIPVIVQLKAEGFITLRKIAEEMNKRKIETFRSGDKKWHASSLHALLKRIPI